MRKVYEKHGLADSHRLYSTWKTMRNRCNNPNNSAYPYYGAKGIKVCKEWDSFLTFLKDMEPTFKEGLTLDRVDNDGDYTPENCKWSTKSEQCTNQKGRLYLNFEGVVYTEAQLSRHTGVSRTTLQTRRKAGATPEEMVYGFNNVSVSVR